MLGRNHCCLYGSSFYTRKMWVRSNWLCGGCNNPLNLIFHENNPTKNLNMSYGRSTHLPKLLVHRKPLFFISGFLGSPGVKTMTWSVERVALKEQSKRTSGALRNIDYRIKTMWLCKYSQ